MDWTRIFADHPELNPPGYDETVKRIDQLKLDPNYKHKPKPKHKKK